MEAFFHGFVLAFGLIIPLGVQNVFVFNQGASQPVFLRALPAVVTAALCDTLLILLAVLGVSLIVLQLDWMKTVLFGAGFFFLLYMGWATWRSGSAGQAGERTEPFSAKRQIAFAASVSLLNPHAILDTIGVIGTSSLAYSGMEKGMYTLACILVSCLWFLGLAIAGRALGKLDTSGRLLPRINKLSALIIWAVACYMGFTLLREWI